MVVSPFISKTMSFTAAQIAEQVRGEVLGDTSTLLTGFSAADNARAGDLTFADKEEYFLAAEQSAASAILVSGSFNSASTNKVLIRVANARIATARLLPIFFP
ncbi:MAG: lpxD, partial [Verrucomicrobiales bacterium]|nr:lpxD [Verrucomicrobiales bacterium]